MLNSPNFQNAIDQGECSIIYMIDPPHLVSPSIPLLISLRKHHPTAKIIPYVPKGKLAGVPDRILRFHEELDAPIQELTRELAFSRRRYDKPYVHGHKILAAAERRSTEFCIFVDTDTYITQPLSDPRLFQRDAVGVVPESVAGYARRFLEIWDATYAIFGLTTPSERVLMLRSDREHPPYFNAGFVAFPEMTPSGEHFGELWLETALTLDFSDAVDDEAKRPWLDQASLPVAILRAGCRYEILERDFNYPIDAGFPPQPSVRLYHYHGIERLEVAGHTAEIEELIVSSGKFRSLEHFLAPLKQQRAEAAVVWKQIGDLAVAKRELKQKLQNPEDHPGLDVTKTRQQIALWKREELDLRAQCSAIVEHLFYDEDWLRPS